MLYYNPHASSNAYHEIEKVGNLDAIFGNQNTDYLEISQDYMSKALGKGK